MTGQSTQEKLDIQSEVGAQEIAPKAQALRQALLIAASVALLDIEENEKAALEKIRQEAGEKRGKIKKQTQEILSSTDMKVIRRFWNVKSEDMFMHFLGDRTKVGGFGSDVGGATN
jgi:hypothetical protein